MFLILLFCLFLFHWFFFLQIICHFINILFHKHHFHAYIIFFKSFLHSFPKIFTVFGCTNGVSHLPYLNNVVSNFSQCVCNLIHNICVILVTIYIWTHLVVSSVVVRHIDCVWYVSKVFVFEFDVWIVVIGKITAKQQKKKKNFSMFEFAKKTKKRLKPLNCQCFWSHSKESIIIFLFCCCLFFTLFVFVLNIQLKFCVEWF